MNEFPRGSDGWLEHVGACIQEDLPVKAVELCWWLLWCLDIEVQNKKRG